MVGKFYMIEHLRNVRSKNRLFKKRIKCLWMRKMLINHSFSKCMVGNAVDVSHWHSVMGTKNNSCAFRCPNWRHFAATSVKIRNFFSGVFTLQMFTRSPNHTRECQVCRESVKNMLENSGYLFKASIFNFSSSMKLEYKYKEGLQGNAVVVT